MEQMNQGVGNTKKLPTFHIVFQIQNVGNYCTSVNIDAENVKVALEIFALQYPDKIDEIIYVTNLENCKL